MPAPTVTVRNPPPTTYPAPGIVRPGALVAWTGGTGPFDVLHEWDTSNSFPAPLQDLNAAATSPNVGTPPADLGPAGTTWYYRARVTDTSDATFTVSPTTTLTFADPQDADRWLHLLANVGVGFGIDEPGGGWGPDPDPAPDGSNRAFDRFLYLLANIGVGFAPTDDPPGGWGPGAGAPGDGDTIDQPRFLYLLGNLDTTTPTPHVWYVFPAFGEEGWEFQIVGYGFGDTQAALSGSASLNGDPVGVVSWTGAAQTSPDLTIDPDTNTAEPVHQVIRATVPAGGTSGLVVVCTDGP